MITMPLIPLLFLLSAVPFQVGEKVVLKVRYGLLTAGDITLEVKAQEPFRGRDSHHFLLTAETKGTFSKFYKMADEIHSYVDTESFATLRYEKDLEEGDYRAHKIIDYDPDSGLAFYPDSVLEIPKGALDPLAVFYYVRLVDSLRVGDTLEVPYHVDKRSQMLKLPITKEKKLKTIWGKISCLLVEQNVEGDNIFGTKGGFRLWITNDARKIPVRMEIKVPFGTLRGKIKEYQAGRGSSNRGSEEATTDGPETDSDSTHETNVNESEGVDENDSGEENGSKN